MTVFSSLAIFNILAIKAYIQDTKTVGLNTIKKACVNAPKVAITFDDGPSPDSTAHVLALFKEKKAKATFFVLGKNAEAHPELLQQIHAEGHEIGNHAYSHQRLTRLSQEGIKAELHHTNAIIYNITRQKTTHMRPPDNAYNAELVNLTQQLGYNFILWSIDTRDWTNASVSSIIREIDKAKPGDIILFHDGVTPSHTMEALPKAIDLLQAKGFQLVTVSELLSDN
jgi:polysaccharide deacetylase family sporulation protein PdaB